MSLSRNRARPQTQGLVIAEHDCGAHLLQTLREHGYEIAICPLARGALLMTNDIEPSLIILDVALNDADGRDVLKALKKNERTSSIPVIVWSARDYESDRLIAHEHGAFGYLPKRDVLTELLPLIGRALANG